MARAVLRGERSSSLSISLLTRGQVLAGPLVPELENSLWFLQGRVLLPGCGGEGGEPSCPSTAF